MICDPTEGGILSTCMSIYYIFTQRIGIILGKFVCKNTHCIINIREYITIKYNNNIMKTVHEIYFNPYVLH